MNWSGDSSYFNTHEMAMMLLADAEQKMNDALTRQLSGDGHEVFSPPQSEALASAITRQDPDVLVMGLIGTGSDRLNTLAELREQGAFQSLPVIVIQVCHFGTARLEHYRFCVDDVITEPFAAREVSIKLAPVLRWATPGGQPLAELTTINQTELVLDFPGEDLIFHADYRHWEHVLSTLMELLIVTYRVRPKRVTVSGLPELAPRQISIPDDCGLLKELAFEALESGTAFLPTPNEQEVRCTVLGLRMARQAILLHGGSLGMKISPGSSTTFIIELPHKQHN
jgi:DNA-binding response OmpR family regulator